jgi:hypothetical protein
MKLKYPKSSKYTDVQRSWIAANHADIDLGEQVSLYLGERTGFVKKNGMLQFSVDTFIKKDGARGLPVYGFSTCHRAFGAQRPASF